MTKSFIKSTVLIFWSLLCVPLTIDAMPASGKIRIDSDLPVEITSVTNDIIKNYACGIKIHSFNPLTCFAFYKDIFDNQRPLNEVEILNAILWALATSLALRHRMDIDLESWPIDWEVVIAKTMDLTIYCARTQSQDHSEKPFEILKKQMPQSEYQEFITTQERRSKLAKTRALNLIGLVNYIKSDPDEVAKILGKCKQCYAAYIEIIRLQREYLRSPDQSKVARIIDIHNESIKLFRIEFLTEDPD